jgi:hypothetical protein
MPRENETHHKFTCVRRFPATPGADTRKSEPSWWAEVDCLKFECFLFSPSSSAQFREIPGPRKSLQHRRPKVQRKEVVRWVGVLNTLVLRFSG